MPGILLDQSSMNGVVHDGAGHHLSNGVPSSAPAQNERDGSSTHLRNGVSLSNGVDSNRDATRGADPTVERSQNGKATFDTLDKMSQLPPEIQHITQDFIPLAKLVNRSAQHCFNDLTELINELAEVEKEPPSQPSQVNGRVIPNGVPPVHQSQKSIRKKERILNFAQDQRAWFIKLLVLSQWSRNAGEVSRVIDLNAWINMQKWYYEMAGVSMGELKRSLAHAQLPNPDLKTALEVLSTGKVSALPDVSPSLDQIWVL